MTPVITVTTLPTSGVFTVTTSDTGTNFKMLGDASIPDFNFDVTPVQSRVIANGMYTGENARDLETKRTNQAYFETEMGAELLAWNSQALVKDANFDYVQTTTKLAFESYVKGLDGHP